VRKALLLLTACASLTGALEAQAPMDKGRLGIPLTEVVKPWTGDLDGMAERRMVRVLTTYSKTQYFIDQGTPRGTAYDQGRLLETALNEKLKTGNLKIAFQFIPVSRDDLIPALVEGKGDIVMATLTVTPEREKVVDFTDPTPKSFDGYISLQLHSGGQGNMRFKDLFVRDLSKR